MKKNDNYPKSIDKVIKEFNKEFTIDSAVEVFRYALESSPIPLLVAAEDGDFLIMSESCFSETGYSQEEIGSTEKWVTTLHPENAEYNRKFIRANFDRGVVTQGEVEQVVTKSGDVRYWAFHNTQMGKLEDGRKVQLTLCVDVTDEYNYREKTQELLQEIEKNHIILQGSLESQGTVVIIDKNFDYLYFNKNHQKSIQDLYGLEIKIGKNILDVFTIEADKEKEISRYKRALSGESFTEVDVYGTNQNMYFETKYSPLVLQGNIVGVSIFTSDVTESLKHQREVQESEEKFRLIYSTMSQGLGIHEVITDETGVPIDYRCLDMNDSYLKMFNYKREDIIGKRVKEFAPALEDKWIKLFGYVALTGESQYFEGYSTAAGMYLATYSYSPKPGQFVVLISDISERIEREKEIEFLSFNDSLTGVYNRRYYEKKIQEIDHEEYYPVSIIVGDVNGLKLVNDTFGHLYGDKLLKEVSKAFFKSCRNSDIVTRIGGDEFVIILPNSEKKAAKAVLKRIDRYLEEIEIESIEVSVSFGTATKYDSEKSFDEIFSEAEDKLYKHKATDSKSMRSKTINLIMTTLYEKNEREMNHSKRVGVYCEKLASAMNLSSNVINQVKNAGLMHDIGKIGIEEALLNKVEKPTVEEFNRLYEHSEIGYRILSALPEYTDIANYVLEHHERIDGTGYPNGLSGEEISLQAKIIAVTDSYDAMTGPRPYTVPLSKSEAIKELRRCSGTQFDTEIAELFIKEVIQKEHT